jgi:hypothetical protein
LESPEHTACVSGGSISSTDSRTKPNIVDRMVHEAVDLWVPAMQSGLPYTLPHASFIPEPVDSFSRPLFPPSRSGIHVYLQSRDFPPGITFQSPAGQLKCHVRVQFNH